MTQESSSFRIVIADDHVLFRQGLAEMLRTRTTHQVVGQACDGNEAWTLIDTLRPDIAILDMAMPGARGTAVIKRIREQGLQVLPIVLTMHIHSTLVAEAERMGAQACVAKDDAFEELATAIDEAMADRFFLSKSMAAAMVPGTPPPLAPRERDVVTGIIHGETNKELAQRLGVSIKTIETHRTRLMKKLGARNTADIVRIGITLGLE